jgi:LytS/YehU family sensor histidine kinase
VKHGFRNTKKDGLLIVTISPKDNGVFIAITNNGIGRKEASKFKDSSGHGLKTMDEFYRLFEKYHGYKIKSRVVDLKNQNGSSTGTKVELIIEKKD